MKKRTTKKTLHNASKEIMRKAIIFTVFFMTGMSLFAIVPGYYGARSLSLGYASSALNFDINAIFLNPALLTAVKNAVTGYQYQNSYIDYRDFTADLSAVLEYDLKNFESLPGAGKEELFSKLHDLFQSKSGMYGFSSSVPGFISRGYGISISVVKTAIIDPAASDIFSKGAANISNSDIASLKLNFLGLSYKQISLAYALPFSEGLNLGIALHYLDGKVTEFDAAIIDNIFTPDSGTRDYLEFCWGEANNKFSKLVMDVGLGVNFGSHFNLGVHLKNIAGAKIKTSAREITLDKRITAGLAFAPEPQWGIYLDMDITSTDLLYSGEKMQPLSLGVEKGFFSNKFFLRAGFLTDLTEKYFIGRKSNSLYGMGFAINLGYFIVDFGLGIAADGSVDNLAVSGFFVLK